MIDEHSRRLAAEFHVRHCDASNKDDNDHVCQGRMTITAAGCTFECPRCGEDRINIIQQVAAIRLAAAIRKAELDTWWLNHGASIEGATQ